MKSRKHIAQPESVVLIICVLKPGMFLDAGRIREMNLVSFGHEQVHQPVPVVGGLHDDPDDLVFVNGLSALRMISGSFAGFF